MRYFSFLILLLSLVVSGYSQTPDFGANGFKWYYTYNTFDPDYVSYSYIVFDRDTTVNGIEAKVLCEYVPDNLNRYSLKSENIVYSQDSKVYRYSTDVQRFCLLYDFGKVAGESWLLDEYGVSMYVDSVAQIEIGGELRNVQYAHCTDTALYDSFGNRGIVDGIGSLKCLFPNQVKSYTDGLRCISDTTGFSYHFSYMPDCEYQTGPRYYKSIFGKEKTEWWVGYMPIMYVEDDNVYTMPHDTLPCLDMYMNTGRVFTLCSDTVLINGKTYQKINYVYLFSDVISNDLYIREDTTTGDVFRLNRYGEEQLVFTMNLNVGDTFIFPEYIDEQYNHDIEYFVDSVAIHQGRKVIHLSKNSYLYEPYCGVGFVDYDRIVEGFGPSYGFFGGAIDSYYYFPTSCIAFNDTLVYSLYPECGCELFVVGHRSTKMLESCNIYPNPACDFVNLEIPETISGEYSIKVFDSIGTVVYDGAGNGSTYTINVSQFSDGMYSIVIYYMGVYHVGKFVKY